MARKAYARCGPTPSSPRSASSTARPPPTSLAWTASKVRPGTRHAGPRTSTLKGKRVAVIGTGCTGYQTVPELALEAEHVTVFQRTPQWLFPSPGYRSPFPPQVTWLDRNLPFHTNFMRLRVAGGFSAGFGPIAQIDPDFQDEHAVSAINKAARDNCLAFLREKLGDDEDLIDTMTPEHPVLSARPVIVDSDYSILDAIQRDDVTLVVDAIRGITETGVETENGEIHEVDAIVFATGFKATEYLFPMSITGRDGMTVEKLWSETGAQAYVGAMIPGCPNLWTLYGPNTNGGLLVPAFQEMENDSLDATRHHALRACHAPETASPNSAIHV